MQTTVLPPPTQTPVISYEEAIANLQSAFPTVDREVIDAILELNRGAMEPSFEQLLSISTDNDNGPPREQTPKDSAPAPRASPSMPTSTPVPTTSIPPDFLVLPDEVWRVLHEGDNVRRMQGTMDEEVALAMQHELFVEELGQNPRLLEHLRANPDIAIVELGIDPIILTSLFEAAAERVRLNAKRAGPTLGGRTHTRGDMRRGQSDASMGSSGATKGSGGFDLKKSIDKFLSVFKKKETSQAGQYSSTPSQAISRRSSNARAAGAAGSLQTPQSSRLRGIEGISSTDFNAHSAPVAPSSSSSSSSRSARFLSPVTNAFAARSGYSTLENPDLHGSDRFVDTGEIGRFRDVPSPSSGAEIELPTRASGEALLGNDVDTFFGEMPQRGTRTDEEEVPLFSPFAIVDEDEDDVDERTTLTGRRQKRHV